MTAHYRVGIQVNGEYRYLRIGPDGARDWTPHIAEATTWPTAAEAQAVANSHVSRHLPFVSAPVSAPRCAVCGARCLPGGDAYVWTCPDCGSPGAIDGTLVMTMLVPDVADSAPDEEWGGGDE